MKRRTCALRHLLIGTLALSSALASAADTAADWRALARADLEAGYQLLRENHPGMFDPENRRFAAQLERARKRGLGLAAKASSTAGYSASLGAFNAVLNDGHAGLVQPAAESLEWPGFITAWRNDGLLVYESSTAFPAKGDRVISCDGVAIRKLVERNVFAFAIHNGEASAWWQLAPRVLFDSANPFVRRPARCIFQTSTGKQQRDLTWSRVDPEKLYTLYNTSLNGDRLPVGLSERGSGILWVALPTFSPNEADRQAYDRLFSDLQARRTSWQQARALVLDLRHNGGGSSEWSLRAANQIWGETQVDQAMQRYFKNVEIWWRATPGNAAKLEDYARRTREQGDTESADAFVELAAGLRATQDRGQPFFVEPFAEADSPEPSAAPSLPIPVYVVVPAQCASACLDALDVFTRFPAVKLIGAPSATDSLYMDIRTEPLPSGKSRAVIPMKMWVKRPRASGEAYLPTIEINDLDWSTNTFLARIEADLTSAQ